MKKRSPKALLVLKRGVLDQRGPVLNRFLGVHVTVFGILLIRAQAATGNARHADVVSTKGGIRHMILEIFSSIDVGHLQKGQRARRQELYVTHRREWWR